MTPEDEEFNRIEMESRIKQEYVRYMMHKPDIQKIMEELGMGACSDTRVGGQTSKTGG